MAAQTATKAPGQSTSAPQASTGPNAQQAPASGARGGAGNAARVNTLRDTQTGSGTGAAAGALAGAGGGKGAVPFRDEMEEFFGIDLSGVTAVFGADLGPLDANAAQSGDTVVFADPDPSREQVAHELAHVVQARGGGNGPGRDKGDAGGPAGTTGTGDHAEVQAESAAKAFSAGGTAPQLDAKPNGIARDAADGTTLDRLRTAADGNWIGNVDEDECLSLINALTPAEKATVRSDNGLMTKLAGAFNGQEMLQAVNALEFELKWKANWLKAAGGLNIGPMNWQVLLTGAPRDQLMAFVGWADLFNECYRYFGTNPRTLFAAQFNTPDWGPLLASNPAIVRWLGDTEPAANLVEDIAGAGVTDADLATIQASVAAHKSWTTLVGALPRAGLMPATTRAALKRLKDVWDVPVGKVAFEQRFGHSLTTRTEKADKPGEEAGFWDRVTGNSTTVDWTTDTLRAVWNQLDVLPDQDVTANTVLRSFQAIHDGIGAAGYYANPDIQVTQGIGVGGLDHTVRHEIGHSVHDGPLKSTVNSWLEKDIGFWYMSSGKAGHRELINGLGGFPANWTDSTGTAKPFTADDQTATVDMLTAHTGEKGAFSAQGRALPNDTTPANDEDRKWAAMPAAVRSCYTLSTPNWYSKYNQMPAGGKGKIFWNHYYKRPYTYTAAAEATVAATGDTYTAMSEKEFFANCYAEFFKDPAGFADHSKWGGALPAAVKGFFRSVVLDHQPYTPPSGSGAAAGGAAGAGGPSAPAAATNSEGTGAG